MLSSLTVSGAQHTQHSYWTTFTKCLLTDQIYGWEGPSIKSQRCYEDSREPSTHTNNIPLNKLQLPTEYVMLPPNTHMLYNQEKERVLINSSLITSTKLTLKCTQSGLQALTNTDSISIHLQTPSNTKQLVPIWNSDLSIHYYNFPQCQISL